MTDLVIGKHERFCINIADGLTGEKAYIQAGYSPNGAAQSASRLLRNAEIQARIEVLRNAMAEQAIERAALTRSYVITCLMTIVEQCMQHEPIRDKSGIVLGHARYNPMAAIRALEFLGKELGMFKGRPERQTTMDNMTLEEMKQRQEELDRQLEELDRESQTEPPRKRRGTLH
jgi:Terminase small subunit